MRLLKVENGGNFSLVEYTGKNFPRYAILSHTWGPDNEEVTFDDLKGNTAAHKAGYDKIRFCGKEAARNDLQYFWVDSCCIDKSNSTELSEAINSMFRWYQRASRCYVYLSDVSESFNGDGRSSQGWELAFRRSRWFTRGWTLQELLAPSSVQFFSKEGKLLGSKQSLEQTIHEITGIEVAALRGTLLSEFGVDERLMWAAGRATKVEEDTIYSLLGLFDIHMPLIYGEGQPNALRRLRKEIEEARSDADTPSHQNWANNHREGIIQKIREWLSAPDPSTNYQKALEQRQDDTGLWFLESDQYNAWKTGAASFLWLHGIPGCGKTVLSSTVLQNLIQHCRTHPGRAHAYFYFDFNDMNKQNPELMLRSLISQLSQQCTRAPTSLDRLFSSCNGGQRQPLSHALEEVLQQMIQELPHVYILLDALDECDERTKLMDMLESIATWQLQNLHVLLTSRRERDIESSLEVFVDGQNSICLDSKLVDEDIQRYVRQRLSDDRSLKKWQKDPAVVQEIENTLMKGAHGMYGCFCHL